MRLGNLMWGPPRVLDVSPGNRQPRLLHCGTSRARRFLLGETLMCPVLVACMQAGITNAWLRPVRCVRWSARSRSRARYPSGKPVNLPRRSAQTACSRESARVAACPSHARPRCRRRAGI